MSSSGPAFGAVFATLAAECATRFGKPVRTPVVSVVIPVFNNWHVTEQCLLSVLRCDRQIDYEIVVVDDASTDQTAEALSHLPHMTVVRNARNVGFVDACNRGALKARGTNLLFLNNDTRVHHDSIAALVRRMQSDDAIGIVGSKLVYPDGRLQEAGGIVWSDGLARKYGHGDDVDRPEYNFARDADYVSGAAMLLRTDLFRKLGGFDQRFVPGFYEDVDLCFAARADGLRVVYEPASVVTHDEGRTAGHDPAAGMRRFHELNRPKFASKWGHVLRRDHLACTEDNVYRAARRRDTSKTAVLVIGPKLAGSALDPNRLCDLSRAFAQTAGRVACVPHDRVRADPWTRILQDAGVEVLFGIPGEESDSAKLVSTVLPTVDLVVVIGADLCAQYLPLIRAHHHVPVVYDATCTARSQWYANPLDAMCIRAADGTMVHNDIEAALIREANFGPVAVVPLVSVPDTDAALRLTDRRYAPEVGDATSSAGSNVTPAASSREALKRALDDLGRERAAHRQTRRREALLHLERENAEALAARTEREAAARRTLEAQEWKVLSQHLATAQSVAHAQGARLAALAAQRRLDLEERELLLTRAAMAHELAQAQGMELTSLLAERDADRREREALLRELQALVREGDANAHPQIQRAEIDEANRMLRKLILVLRRERSPLESPLAAAVLPQPGRRTASLRRARPPTGARSGPPSGVSDADAASASSDQLVSDHVRAAGGRDGIA